MTWIPYHLDVDELDPDDLNPDDLNLDDLDFTSYPAFAVDHLPALFCSHAGAEPDFAGALNVAGFVGIMHGWFSLNGHAKRGRSLTFFCSCRASRQTVFCRFLQIINRRQ
jgi:hypothetical protein